MTPREAHISTRRHTAFLDADLADVVHPILSRPRKQFAADGVSGVRTEQVSICYYEVDSRGRLITSAGLVPRLASELRKQGHTVQVVDRTRWQVLNEADHSVFQGADVSADDRELLEIVSGTPRGQIIVRRNSDIPQRIALLVRLFPSARMLIVCRNSRDADSLYRSLRRRLGKGIYPHTDVNWADQTRVVVGTEQSLSSANDLDWNVIVFVGAEPAIHEEPAGRAARMQDHLMYCIRTERRQLGPHETLQLEYICGPEIWRAPDPAGQKVEIRVLMPQGPVVHLPGHTAQEPALDRKRLTIWHNEARNECIADLAAAFADGDVQTLWERGLLLHDDEDGLRREFGEPRVAIMVESTEHGQRLLQLLNGWSLIDNTRNRSKGDTPSDLDRVGNSNATANHPRNRVHGDTQPALDRGIVSGFDESQAQNVDDAPTNTDRADKAQFHGSHTRNRGECDTQHALNRVIVTQVAASRVQLDVDIIVWAGGGEVPQLPMGFPARGADRRRQLWVDIADDWDQDAVEATRGRLRAYQRLGWHVDAPSGLVNDDGDVDADSCDQQQPGDSSRSKRPSCKRRRRKRKPK